MKRLRLNLALLVGFFFGLYLLLYGSYLFHYEIISIFVVMLVSVLMIIDLIIKKLPGFSRNFIWLMGYVFYFVWLIMNNSFHPADSIQSIYRFFTEILIIALGINISGHLSKILDETTIILEQVSLSRLQPATRISDLRDDIRKEVVRSLRYERPLSLLVIDVTKELNAERIDSHLSLLQSEMMENYFEARISHEIVKLTRAADIIGKLETLGRFIIVCPESGKRSAEYLGERITLVLDEKFDRLVKWGVAELKADVGSFEELKSEAERDLENRSINFAVHYHGEEELSKYMDKKQ